jgi:deoxyribose-phosphate aldolase
VAKRGLEGSGVAVCAVVGFPLGAMSTGAKVAEARIAVEDGACELDMVIALGAAKAGEWGVVEADIAAVVEAVGAAACVKVIIECSLLTDAEKVAACEAAVCAGAAFVKTSTGFLGAGATVADVRLLRATVGEGLGVKASGGIRSAADALSMIEAGATRIGTSNGVAIVNEHAAVGASAGLLPVPAGVASASALSAAKPSPSTSPSASPSPPVTAPAPDLRPSREAGR